MYKDTWCTYYFLMRDSKFIKHSCRIIATPVTGACVCACGGTRSQSDWCNSLTLSHACGLPPQCPSGPSAKHAEPLIASLLLWAQDWSGFYDQNWETESNDGRGFQQVYSIYLPLSCIGFFFSFPFFVKFSIIMGTSVQKKKNFLSYVRTFHRWTF